MTDQDPNVKTPSQKLASWLDRHPRTGWYAAIWATLITLNQFWPILDRLLS